MKKEAARSGKKESVAKQNQNIKMRRGSHGIFLAGIALFLQVLPSFGVGAMGNPPHAKTIVIKDLPECLLFIADERIYKKELLPVERKMLEAIQRGRKKQAGKKHVTIIYRGRPGHLFTLQFPIKHCLVKTEMFDPATEQDPFAVSWDYDMTIFQKNRKISYGEDSLLEIPEGKLGVEFRMMATEKDIRENYPKRSHILVLEITQMSKELQAARQKMKEKFNPPVKKIERVPLSKIKVKGIGDIAYDGLIEDVDLLAYCYQIVPKDEKRHWQGTVVNLYLKGEQIVHINKNSGKYLSEDKTDSVIKSLQHGSINKFGHITEVGGLEINSRRESWLNINDMEKMALIWRYIRSGWSSEKAEAGLTPICIKNNLGLRREPDENTGKIVPGIFVRYCRGIVPNDFPYGAGYTYPREESYLRKFIFRGMERGENGRWRWSSVGGQQNVPEGSLAAVKKWKPIFEDRAKK